MRPGRPSSHQTCSSPRAAFNGFSTGRSGRSWEDHDDYHMMMCENHRNSHRDYDGLCVITGNSNHVIITGIL